MKNKCSLCGETSKESFLPSRHSVCKSCRNKIEATRHKERSPIQIEKNKKRSKENYYKDIIETRLFSAFQRAQEKNWEYDLDKEFIENSLKNQNNKCYYSGIEFNNKNSLFSMSLDRKDNTKGYTKDNVVLCCSSINIMKSKHDLSIFIEIVSKIYEHQNKVEEIVN